MADGWRETAGDASGAGATPAAGGVLPPAASHQPPAPRVGYFVGSIVNGMRDGALRWADLAAMAAMAEEVGFASFWLPDHLLFRFPGEAAHGPWECWSLVAALAAATERIGLGTLVACTAYRNPALLAKTADTVDEISGGRLVLGLGAGWHQPEYEAFGYPYDHRVSRFAEALAIISGLLRHGRVDFAGAYHTARDCELRPRGPRPGGPPIMVGSSAPRMLALLAAHGDLWNAWARQTVEEVAADRALVDAALAANGRDPATVGRSVALLVDTPDATGRPSEEKPGLKARTPAELAEHLLAYAALGLDHVQLMIDPNTPAGLEWAARALEEVDRAGPA